MDLKIMAKCANVNAENYKRISVEIEGADIDEIIDIITIEQFVNRVDIHKILDVIGEKECKDYFHLTDIN